jgi:hypothetical protein
MAQTPTDITRGEPDQLTRLQGFMASREQSPLPNEQPRLPSHVEAFLKPREDGIKIEASFSSYDFGPNPTAQQRELMASGNIDPSAFSKIGEKQKNHEDSESEKEKRNARALEIALQQTYGTLLQNVANYRNEYQAAQIELKSAKEGLAMSQTYNGHAKEMLPGAEADAENAKAASWDKLGLVSEKTLTINGKIVRLSPNGTYIDQEGNQLDAEIIKASEDPTAQEMETAREAIGQAQTKSHTVTVLQQKDGELKSMEKLAQWKEEEAAQAKANLDKAEQEVKDFEEKNPQASVSNQVSATQAPSAITIGKDGFAIGPRTVAATANPNLVGGEPIRTKISMREQFGQATTVPGQQPTAIPQFDPGRNPELDLSRFRPAGPGNNMFGS